MLQKKVYDVSTSHEHDEEDVNSEIEEGISQLTYPEDDFASPAVISVDGGV